MGDEVAVLSLALRRLHPFQIISGLIAGPGLMFAPLPSLAADGLYICAEHADAGDWEAEFAKGSVLIPAGTVFDLAGHILGGSLMDPRDSAHFDVKGYKGVTADENERRSGLIAGDLSIDRKHSSAAATTKPVTLSQNAPCALAPAQSVLSKEWGWILPSIVGELDIYYQPSGVIRRGALDTDFSDDAVPLNFLASRGELNASVRGTLSNALDIDLMSASLAPDDSPVEGNGNSECWGDDSRQDISCRALTESFLMSMRGATKAAVMKAMNVKGREIEHGLHFLSMYSQGQRWGSGDVNFLFDQRGMVSVIFASLDPPDSQRGVRADFIWNAVSLPGGCNNLPGTHLQHC